MWTRLHESVEITDELAAKEARELFASDFRRTDRCSLIISAGVSADIGDLAKRLAAYDKVTDPFAKLPDAASVEREIDQLTKRLGRDALEILHRIDGETMWALANEDDFDIDEIELLPDDARAAYEAEIATRVAPVGGGLVLDQSIARPYDTATAIAELEVGRARVARFTTTPARALTYAGFGGWNDCPAPHVQARVWEHWAATCGGVPAVLYEDRLAAIATRPVDTRAALVQLAREVVAYDADAVIEGYLPLLAMLWRNPTLHFWWD